MKLMSLRLSEKLEEKLEKYAHKLDRSKSYLVRKAIETYLENLSKVPEDILKLAVSPVEKRTSTTRRAKKFVSQNDIQNGINA